MKFLVLALALCLGYAAAQQITLGHCYMRGTAADPTITGVVTFTQNGNNVTVFANITGIRQNLNVMHGMHVHAYGDLSDATSTAPSVGSHFTINGNPHGCPENTQNRHMGDMGNWPVAAAGTLIATKSIDLLQLTGNSSIIGRAVVLHNVTDDCATVASSGARLAFCVIGIANPALHSATTNTAVNGFDNVQRAACDMYPVPNSGSTVRGRVYFQQNSPSSPTTVTGTFTGITGVHGIHVHAYGEITADGQGASGHYDPNSAVHSLPPRTPRHVGDMGNVVYMDASNTSWYSYANDMISLYGAQSVVGRMVILHSKVDDCNATNLGARIGQCVIGISNTTGWNVVTAPGATPVTQDPSACGPLPTTSTTGTQTETSMGVSMQPMLAALFAAIVLLFVKP